MRRFFIGALTAFGTLALAALPASAQYVDQPGETPRVGSAGFGAESAEVQGETVTRDDSSGVAGIAGQPAAVEADTVAGATRGETVERASEAGTSRSGGTRSTSTLAFTGISLAAMILGAAGLIGFGAILRRFGRTQTA